MNIFNDIYINFSQAEKKLIAENGGMYHMVQGFFCNCLSRLCIEFLN